MKKRLAPAFVFCLLCSLMLLANDNIDSVTNWKIRQAETDYSQVMRLVHQLTDIYGPRLTGSPSYKAACEWALKQMKQWGMQDAHLEKWDFPYPGWTCDKYAVRVLSPFKSALGARVVAWTPSTKGVVRAKTALIEIPHFQSEEDLTNYLKNIKEDIHGRIVLVGAHKAMPITLNPSIKRSEESELLMQYDPEYQPPAPRPVLDPTADAHTPLELREIDKKIDAFLQERGALVKVTDAARDHGQIRVFANRTYTTSSTIPSIVIRNEDYGRISRILADGIPVEMEVEISNTLHSDDSDSYNVIAEIPGTDKKNQIVMMGAHIDSWHAGTGATDNAAGVAVMMEAARILQHSTNDSSSFVGG
jgi:carboxypeptidase Q